jgi:hypothetical protein
VSVTLIFELLLIGLLLVVYLSHIPIMVILVRKHDFCNIRFNIYSVVSMLPLVASGLLLILGPQDIGGRVVLSKYLALVFVAFLTDWVVCSLFLFLRVKDIDLRTKAKAMVSASFSVALSCAAAIGASYVTV